MTAFAFERSGLTVTSGISATAGVRKTAMEISRSSRTRMNTISVVGEERVTSRAYACRAGTTYCV